MLKKNGGATHEAPHRRLVALMRGYVPRRIPMQLPRIVTRPVPGGTVTLARPLPEESMVQRLWPGAHGIDTCPPGGTSKN